MYNSSKDFAQKKPIRTDTIPSQLLKRKPKIPDSKIFDMKPEKK